MLVMVWQTSPRLVSAIALIRFTSAALPVATLWVWMLVLNAVVDLVVRKIGTPSYIWKLVGLELALTALGDAMGRASGALTARLSRRFNTRLDIQFMEHANQLDLASFEDPTFQDSLVRARRHSGRLTVMLSCLSLGHDGLVLLLFSALFLSFSPWLMLLLVTAAIPACLGDAYFATVAYSILHRRTPERRQLDYLRFLASSEQSVKEVKVFGLGQHLVGRYRESAESLEAENDAIGSRRARVGWYLNLVATGGFYGGYAVILATFMRGESAVGTFLFMTRAFARSRSLLESIVSTVRELTDEALFCKDLFEYFEKAPSIRATSKTVAMPKPIRDGFDFQNVSFAYPGADRLALKDINLRIHGRERLALVGENGAGKSTLVKLMLRLYEPTSGRILLDSHDLREYDPDELRSHVGIVFQDFMRYHLTVTDNIGFGDSTALQDRRRLEVAAHKSLANVLIDRLPNGYDQMLGRRFEGGEQLSGGEWQKLALARAYVRDAQILVLDEPTSGLDPRSEYELFKRFAEVTRGRLVVLISHRFSTVRMADRIVVLQDGAIREYGTHQQLLSNRGNYSSLFELQADVYR